MSMRAACEKVAACHTDGDTDLIDQYVSSFVLVLDVWSFQGRLFGKQLLKGGAVTILGHPARPRREDGNA
jgi:hypothetical protein